MVASFSPHRDAGGTLHLPSPTGIHHVHASSAINQLRRSLSRSPSKSSDFRLLSRPHSPSTKNPHFISSPLSPSRRSGNLFLVPTTSASSPLASHYPSTSRINRSGIRRNPAFQLTRSRTTPSSPAKRVLSDSRDQGNSLPILASSATVAEQKLATHSPDMEPVSSGNVAVHTASEPSDSIFASRPTLRIEKRRSTNFGPFSASPLKRSDVVMNLDQSSLGSPSAKRRSVHGASFGVDFDVFEADASMTSPTKELSMENGEKESPPSPIPQISSPFSTIPKRSSSLRKSTLQQRQTDRNLFSRSKAGGDYFSAESPPASPMLSRSRQRMSFDGHSHVFSNLNSSNLFSTSVSLFSSQGNAPAQSHAAHPLSRTITQSSSGSSFADESPTHEPVHAQLDRPRPIFNFSKSLPAGSTRPLGSSQLRHENTNESSESGFATPDSYKHVKPLPAAFMSTGLISKKNRNVDDMQSGSVANKNMPDTPCKRSSSPVVHKPLLHVAGGKTRSTRNSASMSWTPRNRPTPPANPTPFSKGMGIFGSYVKPEISRRGSFVSIDGDDHSRSQSPVGNHESQSTIESELPPTPTKQAQSLDRIDFPGPDLRFTSDSKPSLFDSFSGPLGPSCKSTFIGSSPTSMDEDSDTPADNSPSAGLGLHHSQSGLPPLSSLHRSRLIENLNSPSPLPKRPLLRSSPSIASQLGNAKYSSTYIASPLGGRSLRHASPHTPQEHIFPPDPSGLSISAHSDQNSNRTEHSSSSALPATPTAPREYFHELGKRPSLTLSGYNAPDVDPCLTSRFDKVELVGTGEFSQVYRVTGRQDHPTQQSFVSPSEKSPVSPPGQERVWAVKKAKRPFAGAKDRERRKQEVEVLKALTNFDHIISYADSWEENNYLYIQTEFCEEGSLDVFLSQVGLKARLDDFRIWKILLELSSGLKHIHDSGFIHLDLKPANILITFEGVLKIADFGMATTWPAAVGTEAEGDREYIGPEILMGRYDKSSDIFALGLIMFETAGNVELPDNGVSWQKLRNGDMSDVPSLTWSGESSNILRDATGNPLPETRSFEQLFGTYSADEEFLESGMINGKSRDEKHPSLTRSGELAEPPNFMVDANNDDALDRIVRWMISPNPVDRPVADQIMQCFGVQWVERRRRAGATIYEGNWGPADDVLAEDAEMIDV
ncbi:WEE/WEE-UNCLASSIFIED protein kinase [Polytolypa hystricis UAMH7299]|uniref:WEE/WEE-UNCLASSIFIED protein kinase n=1 Tax=Polytolypa hystricis (strain UAMH7299) TaxID=1447883 RepID=A0A2B7YAB8_POLH7|nr:WEE/WEE-UNCLASSIFIED protein kinase [Polytolypa hystricis UAMH7299]